MNWMAEEQFGIFKKEKGKKKRSKLGITMPPCGQIMQVVNKDETCYFNVIFYFEIILLIKSLSTVVPVCPILDRCLTWRKGSRKVHVMVIAGCRVKRTSSRPG